jgi:divalent metal cation (Fe/Co/Zn/Cd) transporter
MLSVRSSFHVDGVPGSLVGGGGPMPAVTRSALRVSLASAVWTFLASAAAMAVGIATGALALVAFGVVQLFDFDADVVLVVHFRVGAAAAHLERVVLRIVASGLLALGTVTAIVSVLHLRTGEAPRSAIAGIVLAAVSVVVLTVLALRKRHVAARLSSRALRADGNLTSVGAALAAITVAGTSSAQAFDLWWMDPVAALVIGIGAIGMGAATKT